MTKVDAKYDSNYHWTHGTVCIARLQKKMEARFGEKEKSEII